jgi:hypothetical protein
MDHGFALLCLAMSRFLARSLHDNSSVEVNLIPAERTGILDSKSTVVPEEDHCFPVVIGHRKYGAHFFDREGPALGCFVA